jgi:KDO2-lipid IV(A) lauroyltransferase
MDQFIKSQFGLKLGFAIARVTPPWLGYKIARIAARWISSRSNSDMVRAVRSNQWVVAGGQINQDALDLTVRNVFQNYARSFYELYHHIQDLNTAGHLFAIDPSLRPLIDRPRFDQRGVVVTGLHMSGFDLAVQWFCLKWIDPLALTIPNPGGGRGLEFELRKRTMMDLVPGSVSGIRKAIRYLKQGGMVITGLDRPHPAYQPCPRFFNRPAHLPTHHIFLALKAEVPVVVAANLKEDDGYYHMITSSPIEMDPYPDREDELLNNAEKVLAVAETFIRQAPEQWLITLPVWPEVGNLV